MVWTVSPLTRTISISLLSPRPRSKPPPLPRRLPRATRTRRTGQAKGASRASRSGQARLRFLDLVAVSARPLASLHEGRIALELFREEVEVFSPGEARAVHHRRLLRHQIQLVV